MRPLVLDASAGLKLVHAESGSDKVAALVGTRLAGGMVVPSLFWLEIVNVLAQRYAYSGATVLEAVHELQALGIRTVESDTAALVAVIDLVERHRLTAYDAAYLALAAAVDADLATADRRLALAAGDRAVMVGSVGRLAEERAAYHPHPATWPTWPDAGAYLAQLRAEVGQPSAG